MAKLELWVNGVPRQSPVVSQTVQCLLERKQERVRAKHGGLPHFAPLRVVIHVDAALPSGQGFGMSGAAALSSALALDAVVDPPLTREEIVRVAHIAEVETGGGLGDVVAQSLGGLVLREHPGVAPLGAYRRVSLHPPTEDCVPLLLAVVDAPIATAAVLSDAAAVARIDRLGAKMLAAFCRNPNLRSFFVISRHFATGTGFATAAIDRALAAVEEIGGLGTMAMLGGSVLAYHPEEDATAAIAAALEAYGTVFHTTLVRRGAHIVR